MSPDLPTGWAWARLEDLTEINSGSTPSNAEAQSEVAGEIPWFKVSSMNLRGNEMQMRHSQWWFNRNHAEKLGLRVIKSGSLIFPKLGGALLTNKRRVLAIDAAIDMNLMAITAYGPLQDYLNRFFDTLDMANFSDGSVVPQLKKSILQTIPIPLAPLPEQRRIVARIDELFTEIAEGEAALTRAHQGLDTWRRALLKAAVTGELTRDWREANHLSETGVDLLARIGAECGSSGKQVLRGRRGIAAAPLDTATLALLPEGWVWARLGDLGEISGGVTVDKKRMPVDPVEVPYLRVANVQRGYLELSEVKTIRVERSVTERLELRANDILLNEGGDRDKIGRGWVWQGELPVCIHQNHVFRVRPHHDDINPYFVSHYANEIGRTFFIEKGKQTTNLASISLSKISELPVPLPPAAEAKIIIDRLRDSLDSGADNHRDISESKELSSAIRQSILKAAFEGRLVPQDPTDEPASVLLARLRDDHRGSGVRRRRAREGVDFVPPSLLGRAPSVDPRVEPAGDE
jgi:type I restriction enzyme, S subunit